jgi:hypothetical protein
MVSLGPSYRWPCSLCHISKRYLYENGISRERTLRPPHLLLDPAGCVSSQLGMVQTLNASYSLILSVMFTILAAVCKGPVKTREISARCKKITPPWWVVQCTLGISRLKRFGVECPSAYSLSDLAWRQATRTGSRASSARPSKEKLTSAGRHTQVWGVL